MNMRLSPRGAVISGAAVALLISGVLKENGVLISLGGAGLLLLAIALIFGRWNLSRLHPRIKMPPRVFADKKFDLNITLPNRKKLVDTFGTELRLSLCDVVDIETESLWIPASSASTAKLSGSIPRRGAVASHSGYLYSTFPLGLFENKKGITIDQEILVFPRSMVPREFFQAGQMDDSWMGEGLRTGDGPGEPRGLRPYRPGDSAKHIHWPATARSLARGRSLRVRENDPPGLRPNKARVVFHSYGTDGELIRTDRFERALSLLCGTLRHLRTVGIPAVLQADFLHWEEKQTFSPEAWSDTLTLLAQAKRSRSTEAHDLAHALSTTPADDGLIIISDMPPGSWQSLLPKNHPALVIDIRQHRYGNKPLAHTSPKKKARAY